MALQSVLVQIHGLSSSSADLDSLHDLLRQPQMDSTLRQNAGSLLDQLHALDFGVHSLGCLYLLEAKGRTLNPSRGEQIFLDAAARFLQACAAAQVRRAPAKFVALCHQLRAHAMSLGQPKRCILPLRSAIGKLCPEPSLLSPIHADLFQLCLLAKCYSAASPVIDADVWSVDPGKTACTATDVLLYCYYGGMVEAGRRRYARSLDLLVTALTAPTLVVNAITVAALKKWILVSLLHLAEVPPLPKHAAPAIVRSLRAEAGPYQDLAKLVRAEKADELSVLALAKADLWRADGNAGLVAAVVERATQRKVAALTQTFVTMSLSGVAAAAGLAGAREAEDAVLAMVGRGEVEAHISQRDGMVRFEDDADAVGAGEATAHLHSLIQQSMALAREVGEVDHAVSCDRAYIKATPRGGRGGSAGGGAKFDQGPGDVPMSEVERPDAASPVL